jgi:HEAT repeat protein
MEKTYKELGEKNRPERWMTVYALEKFGVPAVDYLHEALADNDKWVRYAAIDALGMIGDRRSVEHLIRLLREDQDQDVRFASAHALGRIGDPGAAPALMQVANGDNAFIGIAAEEALARLPAVDTKPGGKA